MNWTSFDTSIVLVGVLCAMACALPGCFLVLRKMSMMGDAISHAVLPGLAMAFILTGSRASFTMFLGAALVGVLTAVFTQWIGRFGNVDRGAAMGIVFTTLFALGLILIRSAADHVDLDPGCVLYGAIELTPFDEVTLLGLALPRAAAVAGGIFFLNLLVILLLFKEFRLSAFDPGLADTLGFSSQLLHYLLMVLVAITTVAAFEAVGSVIVIAMLIVPPATALLLTHRLGLVLLFSCLLAAAAALLGHLSAITVPTWFGFADTNTSGMMATASGFLFLLVWLGGLVQKSLHRRNQPTPHSTPSPKSRDLLSPH
ncbi:metal ABC transporter permease [Roseibacillus ishigakijimensis]|uniref:Metal ABC transporter permease n=1 Tax=Roseibacillus ishigakijimensis TaxID=454146 RepID=A0A934RP78_9BACT|nr:metal ABC transporter permease [Roseibacillus ishigakijimensis]MBK1832948.1 metal ABC transporter permease [Roseibacillus ishigakijimensis]